jgi:hypothetical protein
MRSQNQYGERHMSTATWAIMGSLVINLMIALLIAAVFSMPPPATAAESTGCAAHAAAHAQPAPAQPARPNHRYIVAVRMGWAM